jgi:hypothetical protein
LWLTDGGRIISKRQTPDNRMEDNSNNFRNSLTMAAYTVVTPNYLAHALSVRKSFLQHNPDAGFFICIVGQQSHCPNMNFDNFYFINSLEDKRIGEMIQRYDPFEMTCALKPFFASHIFEQHSHVQRLVYLDCDMIVFGSFAPLTDAAITLSPHRTKNTGYLPYPKDYSIISLNRYGVYNAGYFELKRKPETFAFLDWWRTLMYELGYNKSEEHLFSDQLWLNLTHSFFDDVYVNKNPGYNVAIWNLIERKVEERNGSYFVNGEPLVLYHFSKYKIEEPDKLVYYDEPWLTFANFPVLKNIYNKFRDSVMEAGYEKFKSLPYPFSFQKANKKKAWWKRPFS